MKKRNTKNVPYVECVNGRYRVRLTFEGKRFSKSFGVYYNRALQYKKELELKIERGQLTLEELLGNETHIDNLEELWKLVIIDKQASVSASTMSNRYDSMTSYIKKCPTKSLHLSDRIIKWLNRNVSSKEQLRRMYSLLSTYAQEYCERDYFKGEAKGIKLTLQSEPRPLTEIEKTRLLDMINGVIDPINVYLIRFMLLTGCRPSEAIGLTYGQIKEDHIVIDRSITEVKGKDIWNKETKTKKIRYFPRYKELDDLIIQIFLTHQRNCLDLTKNESLVFSHDGKTPIKLSNFRNRIWNKYAPRDSTPYSCRDTFITEQLSKGVTSTQVAVWVGNSTQIIERHYMDRAMISVNKPR